MCGIIGAIGGNLPIEKFFQEASDSLNHRGPDDAGLYYSHQEGIALGHRRLSIIDLSVDGHQPFFSDNGNYVIVFNGEIYNYLELRDELKNFYNFKTKTDTEVLLASYLKWGESCLHKFNGMFAFAIWDRVEKKLFCVRDRLGIKPFFYYFSSGMFYFASEIKGILALGIEAEANESKIFDYLYHGLYDHTDQTFFNDIKSLSPGHYMIWKGGKIEIKKYWDLADMLSRESESHLTDAEVAERFEYLLTDSLRLRFRSDVPLGINLSSGLDSNSLYYFAKKITGVDVNVFSMCFQSNEYNECGLIENSLSREQKKKWHSCYLNPGQILARTDEMNMIQDQPYGGIPTIAYDFLIKLAKNNGVTVLMEGQGVDEILAGYPYYLIEYERDLSAKSPNLSTMSYGQDMSRLTSHEILNSGFIDSHKNNGVRFPEPFSSHLLNAQYRDIRYTKLPRVLRFNDHVTMRHGCELRVPFLDYRIVEFCFFLSPEHKIRNNSQKFALRNLMDGVVPGETKERQKKVFGAIQAEWFKEHFRCEISDLLNSSSFKSKGYWNYRLLNEEVRKFFGGEVANSFFIWQCFNLELWFKKYIKK